MQRVAVKNAIILNIIHNIFSHHDTEVAICSDDLNPHLGIELVWFMVVHATFSNISVISWRSVLLVEETGVPGENHRLVASHLVT